MISIAKIAKNRKKYECEICDYITTNSYDYKKHNETIKHKNMSLSIKSMQFIAKNTQNKKYSCKNCNKEYKDASGLWRHKKICINIEKQEESKTFEETQDLIQYLIKENNDFKQLMIEQNKQILELAKNTNNINNNINTTNNNFNLNVFLNETCKDAMNIMDFVSQLQIGVDDLEETARLGFAGGISKIFINGLKDIDVPHRPVHCTDPKRETLYIKNDGHWNKEDENKKILINAIKHVANKNMNQIPEWKKQHPGHNDSESKDNDKYLKIICESISGSTQEETNKNYNKIIRNIVKETIIEK
jgi:Zinc finger, C2H2 type